MAPARPGVVVGTLWTLGAAALVVLSLAHCAEPTQIVVEVFSDACPGSGAPQTINQTGIAVGTAADIEGRRPSAVRDGCQDAPGVGTLTIVPSDDKDGEVAIKVVTGVERSPDRCDPPGYAGCIVHRRMMRFVPNTTQRAIVRLTLACLNRSCPLGTTCDRGECVANTEFLADGGTRNEAPRAVPSVVEAGVESGVDASDPCAGCMGTCNGAVCEVDCSKVACVGELCAPTLPCNIKCPVAGGCGDVRCTTSERCSIDCSTSEACGVLTCKAKDCIVDCHADKSCNAAASAISLTATGSAKLRCDGKVACRTASCDGPACQLTCSPDDGRDNACPYPAPCTGGCADWSTTRTQ